VLRIAVGHILFANAYAEQLLMAEITATVSAQPARQALTKVLN
jgi:hypothetical protein